MQLGGFAYIDMLPLWETVKNKTVFHRGVFMSQNQKLSLAEKVELVRRCIQEEISIREASRIGGVAVITVRRWICQYELEGAEAFLPYRKNQAYPAELKYTAVSAYLTGEGSLLDICKTYKIRNPHILEKWIEMYNTHGNFNSARFSGGGCYMSKARSTTQEERIQIAKDSLASGKNYGEMAIKYNVSYQQVRTWTLRYEELGDAGLEDRRGKRKKDQAPRTELEKAQIEIEQLKHKLFLVEMERDLLKKLDEIERREAYRK